MKLVFTLLTISIGPSVFAAVVRVTPIADVQRGTLVTVAGTVERITDEDEFRLTDASGRIRVYVGQNRVPAEVGESIMVSGFVDDDLGPREIYARELTRADGTGVVFDRRYRSDRTQRGLRRAPPRAAEPLDRLREAPRTQRLSLTEPLAGVAQPNPDRSEPMARAFSHRLLPAGNRRPFRRSLREVGSGRPMIRGETRGRRDPADRRRSA
jgi:uncharacterized protein YdeI (BOF family)